MKLHPDKPLPPDLTLTFEPVRSRFPGEAHDTRAFRHRPDSPGGKLARKFGCTCPVIHDAQGSTLFFIDGHPVTIYAPGCPVHTPLKSRQDFAKLHSGKPSLRAFSEDGEPVRDRNATIPEQAVTGSPHAEDHGESGAQEH